MSISDLISHNAIMRRVGLPILQCFAFDMSVKNPYAPPHRVHLHAFKHKGYWYHGKNREFATMQKFSEIINPGDTVIEAGGHIGYISQYFAYLTGPKGAVYVFEPGSNNLPYIHKNLEKFSNVTLLEKAVASEDGTATFYEETLTGQNNSLNSDYEYLSSNQENSYVSSEVYTKEVEVVSLDSFCGQSVTPDFIKIDVEGFELNVLQGSTEVLKSKPVIMLEVTKDMKKVITLLEEAGYQLFDPDDNKIDVTADYTGNNIGNVFCYPAGSKLIPHI